MIEVSQHQPVCKEYGVEEKRLRHHQRNHEQASVAVLMEHRLEYHAESKHLARMHFEAAVGRRQLTLTRLLYMILNHLSCALGLFLTTVSYQPSWAFGYIASQE